MGLSQESQADECRKFGGRSVCTALFTIGSGCCRLNSAAGIHAEPFRVGSFCGLSVLLQLAFLVKSFLVGFCFLRACALGALLESLCTQIPVKLFKQVLQHVLHVLCAKLSDVGVAISGEFFNDVSEVPDGL